MKKLAMVFLVLIILVSGCNKELETKPEIAPEITEQKEYVNVNKGVTLNDQEQVQQLILSFYNDLEKKDYASAWEKFCTDFRKFHPKEQILKDHFGADSIKLVSIERYLTEPSFSLNVPENIPTINFQVTLDVKPSESSSGWDMGINVRFIHVIKEENAWRITAIATSP